MGIMQCDRRGCEHVMCNRHSKKYGYICNKCYEEMEERKIEIGTFMNELKGSGPSYDYEGEFK